MSALGRMLGDEIGLHGNGDLRGTRVRGSGVGGGKPVIYAHLDPGVPEASFTVSLGLSPDRVVEVFPEASRHASRFVFGPLVARRGPCADRTPVPACEPTPDGFCERAEVPRYHGDDDTCLALGAQRSELLFYRARGLDPARLPLVLEREGRSYALRSRADARIDGPVVFVERSAGGSVRYRVLAPNERDGAVPEGSSLSDAEALRALLVAHAHTLGLTSAECEAFVDAWAPAFFGTRRRTGPESTGAVPAELAVSEVSLLYFAPRALVDALLPLETAPPAREVRRVFLVRVADGSRRVSSEVRDPAASRSTSARRSD